MSSRPNFIIAGAAKCATTSMARMLGEHPDVYVTPRKESHHFLFCNEIPEFPGPGDRRLVHMGVPGREDYAGLFADAGDASAVGEASVYYLYRPECFTRIRESLGPVRVIVMLRDPVDRAFSAFGHMVRDGRETAPDFESGLDLEQSRMDAGWEYAWHYTRVGFYADQVTRLVEIMGADRVLLLRYEDFAVEPVGVAQEAFEFLGVDPDFCPRRLHVNPSGTVRNGRIHDFLIHPHPVKDRLRPFVPRAWVQRTYDRAQRHLVAPMTMESGVRERLVETFESDVSRLVDRTGFDAEGWIGHDGSLGIGQRSRA